jgi:hypothetical protein
MARRGGDQQALPQAALHVAKGADNPLVVVGQLQPREHFRGIGTK